MPENALAALAIQPAPSMLPALGQFTEMQRNANALQRENALYAALGAGDVNEAARYDPTKANALSTFQRNQRESKAFREHGYGAALGDDYSLSMLTALAPEYGKVVTDVRLNAAQALSTADANMRNNIKEFYPIIGGAFTEAAAAKTPEQRAAILAPLLPIAAKLGMPPGQAQQMFQAAVNGEIDLFRVGLGYLTAGAEAQKQIAQTAFGLNEVKEGTVAGPGATMRMGLTQPPRVPGPMPGPMPQATTPPPDALAPPGTPPAAPGATVAPPAPPTPPAPPAAPGGLPARVGGYPAQPTAGGGFQIPKGAAQTIQSQIEELTKTGSIANISDMQRMSAGTTSMLNALKGGMDLNNPMLSDPSGKGTFWTGAGRTLALEGQKALQGLYSMVGLYNESLNLDIQTAETFRQGVTLMAARLAKESLGYPMSNFDFSVFLQSMPGLDTSVLGNMQLLGVMDQWNARNQAIAQMAGRVSTRGGDPAEWRQAVEDYIDANPIVDPRTGRTISAPIGMGRLGVGDVITVTKEQLLSGEVDKRYHLLPGAQINVTGAGEDDGLWVYPGRGALRTGVPR